VFRFFVESECSTKKRNIAAPSSSIPASGIEPQTIVVQRRRQTYAGNLAMV
jgi:hypothetical protein